MSRIAILAFCILVPLAACTRHGQPLPDRVDYNFHVKPILSDRCYACHGPDAAARQSDSGLIRRRACATAWFLRVSRPWSPEAAEKAHCTAQLH